MDVHGGYCCFLIMAKNGIIPLFNSKTYTTSGSITWSMSSNSSIIVAENGADSVFFYSSTKPPAGTAVIVVNNKDGDTGIFGDNLSINIEPDPLGSSNADLNYPVSKGQSVTLIYHPDNGWLFIGHVKQNS